MACLLDPRRGSATASGARALRRKLGRTSAPVNRLRRRRPRQSPRLGIRRARHQPVRVGFGQVQPLGATRWFAAEQTCGRVSGWLAAVRCLKTACVGRPTHPGEFRVSRRCPCSDSLVTVPAPPPCRRRCEFSPVSLSCRFPCRRLPKPCHELPFHCAAARGDRALVSRSDVAVVAFVHALLDRFACEPPLFTRHCNERWSIA